MSECRDLLQRYMVIILFILHVIAKAQKQVGYLSMLLLQSLFCSFSSGCLSLLTTVNINIVLLLLLQIVMVVTISLVFFSSLTFFVPLLLLQMDVNFLQSTNFFSLLNTNSLTVVNDIFLQLLGCLLNPEIKNCGVGVSELQS